MGVKWRELRLPCPYTSRMKARGECVMWGRVSRAHAVVMLAQRWRVSSERQKLRSEAIRAHMRTVSGNFLCQKDPVLVIRRTQSSSPIRITTCTLYRCTRVQDLAKDADDCCILQTAAWPQGHARFSVSVYHVVLQAYCVHDG
jgi:hypothetical protein